MSGFLQSLQSVPWWGWLLILTTAVTTFPLICWDDRRITKQLEDRHRRP